MSRSCQRAMFSSAAPAWARSTRASPVTCSQSHGFRLWGIADEPFWPSANGSSASRISVRWRLRISVAIRSRPPPTIAQGGDELGVPVALHDLGGDRLGLEPEARGTPPPRRRAATCAKVPTAPEIFPTRTASRARRQALAVPPGLRVPAGGLEPERGRLGVDAVRPADRQRVPVAEGEPGEARAEPIHARDQPVGRLDERERQRRVHHVRGGQAHVDEPGVGADRALEVREEGDDVVPDPRLDLRDAAGVDLRPLADPVERVGGNDAPARPGLADRQLDPEPARVLGVLAPEGAHLGAGVAGDHRRARLRPGLPRGAGRPGSWARGRPATAARRGGAPRGPSRPPAVTRSMSARISSNVNDRPEVELLLGDPGHAAAGRLEREHQAALEVILRPPELVGRDPVGPERPDLLERQVHDPPEVRGLGARRTRRRARCPGRPRCPSGSSRRGPRAPAPPGTGARTCCPRRWCSADTARSARGRPARARAPRARSGPARAAARSGRAWSSARAARPFAAPAAGGSRGSGFPAGPPAARGAGGRRRRS